MARRICKYLRHLLAASENSDRHNRPAVCLGKQQFTLCKTHTGVCLCMCAFVQVRIRAISQWTVAVAHFSLYLLYTLFSIEFVPFNCESCVIFRNKQVNIFLWSITKKKRFFTSNTQNRKLKKTKPKSLTRINPGTFDSAKECLNRIGHNVSIGYWF